jgi:hypothetical protein
VKSRGEVHALWLPFSEDEELPSVDWFEFAYAALSHAAAGGVG